MTENGWDDSASAVYADADRGGWLKPAVTMVRVRRTPMQIEAGG